MNEITFLSKEYLNLLSEEDLNNLCTLIENHIDCLIGNTTKESKIEDLSNNEEIREKIDVVLLYDIKFKEELLGYSKIGDEWTEKLLGLSSKKLEDLSRHKYIKSDIGFNNRLNAFIVYDLISVKEFKDNRDKLLKDFSYKKRKLNQYRNNFITEETNNILKYLNKELKEYKEDSFTEDEMINFCIIRDYFNLFSEHSFDNILIKHQDMLLRCLKYLNNLKDYSFKWLSLDKEFAELKYMRRLKFYLFNKEGKYVAFNIVPHINIPESINHFTSYQLTDCNSKELFFNDSLDLPYQGYYSDILDKSNLINEYKKIVSTALIINKHTLYNLLDNRLPNI